MMGSRTSEAGSSPPVSGARARRPSRKWRSRGRVSCPWCPSPATGAWSAWAGAS